MHLQLVTGFVVGYGFRFATSVIVTPPRRKYDWLLIYLIRKCAIFFVSETMSQVPLAKGHEI